MGAFLFYYIPLRFSLRPTEDILAHLVAILAVFAISESGI